MTAPGLRSAYWVWRRELQVTLRAPIVYAIGGLFLAVQGIAFGGLVSAHLNWRWAFYLVVIPGLLLGILCFLMREPPVGQADAAVPARKPTATDYKLLATIPSYVFNTIATTAVIES